MSESSWGRNYDVERADNSFCRSLLSNGAKESTLSEMLSVLGSSSLDELNDINYKILSKISSFSTIDIANAVMTRFKPLENFCSVADKYLAPMESLESVEQINEWCKEKTHGKIEKIIEQLSPETIMILLNAVYNATSLFYCFFK